jgi:hypothetical protein
VLFTPCAECILEHTSEGYVQTKRHPLSSEWRGLQTINLKIGSSFFGKRLKAADFPPRFRLFSSRIAVAWSGFGVGCEALPWSGLLGGLCCFVCCSFVEDCICAYTGFVAGVTVLHDIQCPTKALVVQ